MDKDGHCGTGIRAAAPAPAAPSPSPRSPNKSTTTTTPTSTRAMTDTGTGTGANTGAMARKMCDAAIGYGYSSSSSQSSLNNIYKEVEIPSFTDAGWLRLKSEYLDSSSTDINTTTCSDAAAAGFDCDFHSDIDIEKLIPTTPFVMLNTNTHHPPPNPTTTSHQIGWNDPPVTKRYTPPSQEHTATAQTVRSMLDAAAAVAPSPSTVDAASPTSAFPTARNSMRSADLPLGRSRSMLRARSMRRKSGGAAEQIAEGEGGRPEHTTSTTTTTPGTGARTRTGPRTTITTSEVEVPDEDDDEEHTADADADGDAAPHPAERYETFSSLEPPMSYNHNKPRLFLAIYHRREISTGTPRTMLGVNAFKWAFIYASKDFSRCYKIYAPSGIARDPPPDDAVTLVHEPIHPEEIVAEKLGDVPSRAEEGEGFLGLVLLSKVSVDMPLERIVDEILKVRLSSSSPSSANGAAHTQAHTPATWTWAAVKKLRRMNRSLVPNSVDDLEARALRFADKRLRCVKGEKKRQRTHWILNITDLGKPVASPADLGDTWQKVLTKMVGEEVTVEVQRRMRRMGLTRKQR